ncbi:hypothetical protein GW796_10405 [archaeon]|nr:hypothetical protein [archaeon]
MKQIIKEKERMKTIDDEKTHHKILFDLGILDDEEDWELFQKMQQESIEYDPDAIPLEIWIKYVRQDLNETPLDDSDINFNWYK